MSIHWDKHTSVSVKLMTLHHPGHQRNLHVTSCRGVSIHWTGLLDWITGLDYWTGLLDWITGLDYWTGLLDWITGLDYWTRFFCFVFLPCIARLN